MIPVTGGVTNDNVARLVASPPIKGTYVPAERLTEQHTAAAARGSVGLLARLDDGRSMRPFSRRCRSVAEAKNQRICADECPSRYEGDRAII